MATVAVPTAPKKSRAAAAAKTAAADIKAAQRAADLLKMGGDATRVRLLCLLERQGETNVTALCAAIGQSQPATSHHLALCKHSGIIECRRLGKENRYQLTTKGRILAEILGRVMAEDAGR
jgi:ArsR family transcriptional regulator, zinc-responsive transcriptional repressor